MKENIRMGPGLCQFDRNQKHLGLFKSNPGYIYLWCHIKSSHMENICIPRRGRNPIDQKCGTDQWRCLDASCGKEAQCGRKWFVNILSLYFLINRGPAGLVFSRVWTAFWDSAAHGWQLAGMNRFLLKTILFSSTSSIQLLIPTQLRALALRLWLRLVQSGTQQSSRLPRRFHCISFHNHSSRLGPC